MKSSGKWDFNSSLIKSILIFKITLKKPKTYLMSYF